MPIQLTSASELTCASDSSLFFGEPGSKKNVFLFGWRSCYLRWENRPANRPASRETGLEMPCCPASDLLWVQITQSYPNRLRFSSCPRSPCQDVIDPVFKEGFFPGKNFFSDQALRRVKQGTKDGGWRSVLRALCRLFQTCRRIGVYLSSEEHLHRFLTRQGLQDMTDSGNFKLVP